MSITNSRGGVAVRKVYPTETPPNGRVLRSPSAIDRQAVVAISDMDEETFVQHMNKRHRSSLGGLPYLWVVDEATMRAWRAFHNRLHSLRIDLKHFHE